MDLDNCCSICLEENDENVSKILECGHKFHKECINEWINLSKKCYYICPICQDKFFKKYCNNISNCEICSREYCRNMETIVNIPLPEEENKKEEFNSKYISICVGIVVLYIGIISIILLVSSEKN